MLDDIRAFAASEFTKHETNKHDERMKFIAAIRAYAKEQHGENSDADMHASRIARYIWDSHRWPT